MTDEPKQFTVNPLLFMAVTEHIDAANPEAATEGVAHILITMAEGYAPHILSTVSPESIDECIDWLVAHRERRSTDLLVEGPTPSDTVQ